MFDAGGICWLDGEHWQASTWYLHADASSRTVTGEWKGSGFTQKLALSLPNDNSK